MKARMLTPAQAARIIGMDPEYIRIAARDCPERLPFPVIRSGNRTHIPAEPFFQVVGRGDDGASRTVELNAAEVAVLLDAVERVKTRHDTVDWRWLDVLERARKKLEA